MTETSHIEMMPSHPAPLCARIFSPLSISGFRAAKVLGVRRATLSDLLNEKAAFSPEMALRIELAFGVSMEMLLRIQTAWDIAITRQRKGEFDVARFEPDHVLETDLAWTC